ncbi:MAG: CopG family antitoxin [Thermodesulfobacteriota bacterium]|nr:CopG family antitoxin [Thermodesulfobacteriota bacterium]
MEKNKAKTLPRSKSIKELIDFFETHDMGDYWEEMPEAHFEVNIKKRKHLVALEEDIVGKLTEIAKSKKVSSESLINAWLKDKIRRVTKIQKVA